MMVIVYRAYGLLHYIAKRMLGRDINPPHLRSKIKIAKGCNRGVSIALWRRFIANSKVSWRSGAVVHYAGFVLENQEWCLPSWIWTNAAIVRSLCSQGLITEAISLAEVLSGFQEECGGWIVRNDYDRKGAIPMMAPNDSAYIANNAFLPLYEITNDARYLEISERCATWIIDTARSDGLVSVGYNLRDNKWEESFVIVDVGFTAGLFANLYRLTNKDQYKRFLVSFINRYIDLFYDPQKSCFATSVDSNGYRQGGSFSRGQAWALEGLIPSYVLIRDERLKTIITSTIDRLLDAQNSQGGWPYNLSKPLMGEDCKAVSVIAKDLLEWFAVSNDKRILECAKKAYRWCLNNTVSDGECAGGIFAYCVEGAIVKDLYSSCAFVYASAYAIELQLLLQKYELS